MSELQNFAADKNGPPENPGEKNAAKKTAAEETAARFPHAETAVARQVIGISRDECRVLRKQLQRGVHWEYRNNGQVFLSDAGVARLRELKNIPAGSPDVPTPPSQSVRPPRALIGPPPSRVVAWRAHPHIRNAHIVEAYVPGTDPKDRKNIVRVKVKSNLNFVPGMEMPVKLIEADYYEFTGTLPRSKGKY